MNKQILSLRDFKVSVIDEIKCLVQELKSIQAALDLSEHLPLPPIPQLHPDEVPEKKFEYDTDILLKFKQEQEAKAKFQEPLEGSPSSGAPRRSFLKPSSLKESGPVTQPAREHPVKTTPSVVVEQKKLLEIEKAEPTEMELEILKREKIKNLYLQDSLIKKVGNQKVFFFNIEKSQSEMNPLPPVLGLQIFLPFRISGKCYLVQIYSVNQDKSVTVTSVLTIINRKSDF